MATGTTLAHSSTMETALDWIDTMPGDERQKVEMHSRVLRNKLINLTLDWELAALTLDAHRYKSQTTMERDTFRDSANIYRKCISEVTELLHSAIIGNYRNTH